MREFQPPEYVQESVARRASALGARQAKTCVYDGCDELAYAARGGSAARCQAHDAVEFTPPPIPDPARTLNGLRARAGLTPNAFLIGRTVLDARAETKGQRVSVARRRAARGDAA